MAGILDTNILTQVGFVVHDLEKTKRKFAEFFGIPVPPTCNGGSFEVSQTQVAGVPSPDANCEMAFFQVGPNIAIELIQPNETKSAWRDYLNEHGEGIHHLAFNIKGMDGKIRSLCEFTGGELLQRGKYGDGNGEYAYVDCSKDLKCMIELLENY